MTERESICAESKVTAKAREDWNSQEMLQKGESCKSNYTMLFGRTLREMPVRRKEQANMRCCSKHVVTAVYRALSL